jgi:hypothetical protein
MNVDDSILHVARLESFLGNAGGVVALLDDAREKSDGEYIIDRQYIVSLVDGTVERLRALVLDAVTILPSLAEGLYGSLDAYIRAAAGLQKEASSMSPAEDSPEPPEYVLLGSYIAWMDRDGDSPSVRGFAGRIVDAVFEHVGRSLQADARTDLPIVRAPGDGARLDVPGSGPAGPGHVRCRPLRALILACPGKAPAGDAEWLAISSEDHLSLRRRSGSPAIFLEATLPVVGGSGMLFVYEAGREDLVPLPGAMRAEPTPAGRASWCSGRQPRELEAVLAALAREMLA